MFVRCCSLTLTTIILARHKQSKYGGNRGESLTENKIFLTSIQVGSKLRITDCVINENLVICQVVFVFLLFATHLTKKKTTKRKQLCLTMVLQLRYYTPYTLLSLLRG